MTFLFQFIRLIFTRFSKFLPALLSNFAMTAMKWSITLGVAGLLGFTDVGKEILLWGFDGLLSVLDYILSLIVIPDALTQWSLQAQFDSLPFQLLGLLGYTGIAEASVIIATAVGVRVLRDILRF